MNKFTRRTVIAAACAAAAMTFGPMSLAQQAPEKKDVTIAVGGKSLYYYLPLSIAEQLGYFKDEGLNVKIVDFQAAPVRFKQLWAAVQTLSPEPLNIPSPCRLKSSP